MNGRKARERRKALVVTDIPVDPEAYARQPYVTKMLEAAKTAKTGEITHVVIYHDSWCGIYRGGLCNCNPTVTKLGDEDVH
jgi:methyl coenzyme M reductase subunit C